jgi:predicted amidohydrolase
MNELSVERRTPPGGRLRVATTQYLIRPITSFHEFSAQVTGLVETAADYKTQLLVFPEYFTLQLLTLGDVRRPIATQVRDLARAVPDYVELLGGLATKHGVYIVGGSIPVESDAGSGKYGNQCFVFSPGGQHAHQRKLHMTRWESEEWGFVPGHRLRVFDTALGRLAVAICYDVEFPEIARSAARRGAEILVVPSCTDDRQGFLRVRYCAQARAIENQMYVIHSCTVGSLPAVPAVSLNYGQASVLTPSDFPFARDGIRAEGIPNQESTLFADLDLSLLHESRESGTVLPLRDSRTTAEVLSDLEEIAL